MVTCRSFAAAALALISITGCGSSTRGEGGDPAPTPSPVPGQSANRYPGHGFIVHEWGTDTIVVGSDGSMQRGLHHEEEDLPAFVYDRMSAGTLPGSTSMSVDVKMETPVTYFYSDVPLTATVAIDFPKGVFTQWYPAVSSFYPFIMGPNSTGNQPEPADPVLDPSFPFQSATCAAKYNHIGNGLLDWGKIEILARGDKQQLPEAPLEQYSWSFARAVDANELRVQGVPAMGASEAERFLFYRGLGNFDLPARVTAAPGGKITVQNQLADSLGGVFVLHVDDDRGSFAHVQHGDVGVPGGASIDVDVPQLEGAPALDQYADSLAIEVTAALETTGLYRDEAVAMVSTWKRQWFRTPGVRVLYLSPQSWTDDNIPLSIEPRPESTLRVMVMRVEVISPELEAIDVAAAEALGGENVSDAKAHFVSLGRFAEPRLRRALSLLGDPSYAQPFLAQIATADTRVAAGE
jgi:hypothetical protein